MKKNLLLVTALSLSTPTLSYAFDVEDCKAESTVYLKERA